MSVVELVERGVQDSDIVSILRSEPSGICELDLRGNELSDMGALDLANALREVDCKITCLRLWGNSLGVKGASAIASALTMNTSLLNLDLGRQRLDSEHPIGDAIAKEFAAALPHNATLQSLDLRYLGISDVGACALACALPRNRTLKHLDVRYNVIGGEGATALAVSLGENDSVRIYLKANSYDDKAAAALATLLESDSALAPLAAGQERLWF